MDVLAGVHDLPWAALDHCFGASYDIPDLLRETAAGGTGCGGLGPAAEPGGGPPRPAAGCGTLWYDFTAFPETSAPATKSVWTSALHPAVPRSFPCDAEAARPS